MSAVQLDRPVRVVLIDDTPDIRLLVRVALEANRQFHVVGDAGDGQRGVEVVRTRTRGQQRRPRCRRQGDSTTGALGMLEPGRSRRPPPRGLRSPRSEPLPSGSLYKLLTDAAASVV